MQLCLITLQFNQAKDAGDEGYSERGKNNADSHAACTAKGRASDAGASTLLEEGGAW